MAYLNITFITIILFLVLQTFATDFEDRCLNSGLNVIFDRESCLVISSSTKAFEEAKLACNDLKPHGHLVHVTDQKRLDVILGKITSKALVGLKQEESDGEWKWIDEKGELQWTASSSNTVTLWAAGQPDDTTQSENCAIIDNGSNKLEDIDCSTAFTYICEYHGSRTSFAEWPQKEKKGVAATDMKTLNTDTILKCSIECSNVGGCSAFSYHQTTQDCRLHFTGESLEDGAGYSLFNKI